MNKKKGSKKEDDWEYFDDCAICQAMEEAEKQGKSLGEQELETVFAKQNLKNKRSLPSNKVKLRD